MRPEVVVAIVLAIGVNPSRALVLSQSQFQNVLRQNVEISMAVMQALGVRLRDALGVSLPPGVPAYTLNRACASTT